MTWEELKKRCLDAGEGWREEHVHVRVFKHLEDLGWLRHFEFYDKDAHHDSDLYMAFKLCEETPERPEMRLLLRLVVRANGVCAVAKEQIKYPDTGYSPYPSPHDSYCETDDPAVLECWLRRQSIDWSSLA